MKLSKFEMTKNGMSYIKIFVWYWNIDTSTTCVVEWKYFGYLMKLFGMILYWFKCEESNMRLGDVKYF
jgi:hypothetical protein